MFLRGCLVRVGMEIGLVVNPIAGMGGRVGLKGTDGKVEEARRLGAEPRAQDRAREALEVVKDHRASFTIVTYGGEMGEDVSRSVGFEPVVVGDPGSSETSASDTRDAILAFVDRGVDVVLFVGGDGTAVDVALSLEDADSTIPMLGVPAGVKVYSSVFGVNPRASGRIVATFRDVERREVVDLDEEAYRDGRVETELKAVVTVPVGEEVQSMKQLAGGTVSGVVDGFLAEVEPGTLYILGPGSTVGEIKQELGFEGSPLGVDVWRDGAVLLVDASEEELLSVLEEPAVIVVSPIGGQGFVFGRGNAQISPEVIEQCDVEIVASRRKLDELPVLRVDTGDASVDESLRGWHRVRVGRVERRMMKIV